MHQGDSPYPPMRIFGLPIEKEIITFIFSGYIPRLGMQYSVLVFIRTTSRLRYSSIPLSNSNSAQRKLPH